MLNDKQLETASRTFCELNGMDADEVVEAIDWSDPINGVSVKKPRWQHMIAGIKNFEYLKEAIHEGYKNRN